MDNIYNEPCVSQLVITRHSKQVPISTTVMYLLLIFALIELCTAKMQIFVSDSPLIQIAGRVYKKELLTNQYSDPKELSYDPKTRNLYFMYMDDDIQNSGRAYINVETKESMKIKGIKFNKATAVDKETGDIYFGSENGLFKYDPVTNEADHIGLYNVNILKLVARDGDIYLIDANNHMLYKVLMNGTVAVKMGNWKTVMEFDVDYENNIHFVTMCGVYCAIGGHETVKNTDLNTVYHFMVERDIVLGMTENGLYKLDCRNGTAEKIGNINFFPRSYILGEDGDVFYSIENDIYRLKTLNEYYVYNILRKDKDIVN